MIHAGLMVLNYVTGYLNEMAELRDLNIVSYNLHGLNQGISMLPSLCMFNNIVLIQEHWLYPGDLGKLDCVDENFLCIATSAMNTVIARAIRHGRPFGGLGILVRKELLQQFKCVAKRDRFLCISIGAILIVNVYFPTHSGIIDYEEQLMCLLQDIRSVVLDSKVESVIIGGDFNVDFNRRCIGSQLLNEFMQSLNLVLCDNVVVNGVESVITYRGPSGLGGSFIDHFCMSKSLHADIVSSCVIDSGDNLSDHLPLCISLCLHDSYRVNMQPEMPNTRLRWDKADLNNYYSCAYERLAALPVTNDMQHCLDGCKCDDAQLTVDWLYNSIVSALKSTANLCIPRVRSGFFKWWWDDSLTELKQASIDAHNLWKASGSPRAGDVYLKMKQVKLAYKTAIKVHRQTDDLYFSNELHELLMEKDMVNFWRTWNAKISKPKPACVVDGETDIETIAQRFADHFKCDNDDDVHSNVIAGAYGNNEGKLQYITVELVSHCLSQMKRNKAPGIDGIETEHLLYAHPIAVVQLCVLFNIMLKHSVVPELFCNGIIVPVIKDKHGDTSDLNNYRAITISPCISKLFEMCLLEQYSSILDSSPLQFGFKKKLGCSHAIYTLHCVSEYFTQHGSNVNICLLDLSKAFDRVDYAVLFQKLSSKGLPNNVVQLLFSWYRRSNAFVRWKSGISKCFNLTTGVRQGGVLSPVLFTIYVDCVISRLQTTGVGCCIGNQYFGCVMYADDLVLLSVSIADMQTMVDICVDELQQLKMVLNPRKCCIIRVGGRFSHKCSAVTVAGEGIPYCHSAKYLGVQLLSSKTLTVDLRYMKSKFYAAFNGLFHRAAKINDRMIVLHLVSSYCKPYLLYGTDCVMLTNTQSRSLCHTWLTAISHVFNVSGTNVNYISSVTCNSDETIESTLLVRRIRFLKQLSWQQDNPVLQYLYRNFARKQLLLLNVDVY